MIKPGASQATLATALLPSGDLPALLRASLLMLAGSIFIALSAQVRVPLWPVPMTGQTFAVLLVGVAYGTRLGTATLLLYVAEGLIGLPVFANFAAGPAVFAGPTGGYLIGFVVAAALVGHLAERGWDRSVPSMAAAMAVGNLVIYLTGVPWLTAYLYAVGADQPVLSALTTGVVPFLLGDVLKLALAASLLPLTWRLINRR